MSISWGSYEDSTSPFSAGMRVGIQVESQSSVVNGSTTFVVTVSFWTQNHGAYSDDQVLNLTSPSGDDLSASSISYHNGEGTTATKRGTNKTLTYTYGASEYGSSPGSTSVAATASGVANGVTPSKTVSVTIPARPFSVPTAPSAVTATRVSDTQQTIAWTNHSSASGLYQNVKVYRKTDGGSESLVATLAGTATSYSDTTTVANHKYEYSVSASNTAGESTHTAAAAAVWTTPGTPTGCTATKLGNGDIRVDWANNVGYSEYSTIVEHSTNGGSSWSDLDTVAGGTATYTHVTPGTGTTHTYRVRAHSTSGLDSAESNQSATIALLSTANPPTGLSPSGVALDASQDIVLTWTHNPTDSTPQSKRRIQVKIDAGSYSDLVNASSTLSSYTVAGGTWSNGHTITYKIETAGQNGTLSADSAESSFTTADIPTVTISAPTATYDASHLIVEWAYFQAQASAQATWQAKLYDDADNLLETITGTTETEGTFATALQDGASYTVKVTVVAANGLSSAEASQAFDVTFLPPAAVAIAAAYDADSGSMVLTVTGDDPTEGVTEPIATVDVQRSLDGGLTWVTIATGIVLTGDPLTATLLDLIPTIAGVNTYRAVAFSDLPSSTTSTDAPVTVTPDADSWSFVSGGPGFATICRLRSNMTLETTASLAKQLYSFADRPDPVELSGTARTLVLQISGTLTTGASTLDELEALAMMPGTKCWRDLTGRRVFGSLGKVSSSLSKLSSIEQVAVSTDITRIDFTEGVA